MKYKNISIKICFSVFFDITMLIAVKRKEIQDCHRFRELVERNTRQRSYVSIFS